MRSGRKDMTGARDSASHRRKEGVGLVAARLRGGGRGRGRRRLRAFEGVCVGWEDVGFSGGQDGWQIRWGCLWVCCACSVSEMQVLIQPLQMDPI